MPTIIKADVKKYSVEIHDLAVLLLHDPKYPLQSALFLYILALTDKNRRGQLARILGTHPMNSDAMGRLFGVNGATIRRNIKRLIERDLLRYSETRTDGKQGKPPVKRRHYTVMTGKLTHAAVALSKDIAASNKEGVVARRMGVDPERRLVVNKGVFSWEFTGVRTCTQAEKVHQRACTHALYPTVQALENKSTGSIYSGVTPEKNTNSLSDEQVCNSEVTAESAANLAGLLSEVSHLQVAINLQEALIAGMAGMGGAQTDAPEVTPTAQEAQISPDVAAQVLGLELADNQPNLAPPERVQGNIPAGVAPANEASVVSRIIALAKAQNKFVDPVELSFELQTAGDDSMPAEERQAITAIRNWGLSGPDEAALICFVSKCKVYPSIANKGKASYGLWSKAMQMIANEGAMGSFAEACEIAVAKSRERRWSVTSPASVKPIAVEVAGLKRRNQWVSVKDYISRAAGITPVVKKEGESTGKEILWITKAEEQRILAAKTVAARKAVYQELFPNKELTVRGDDNDFIGDGNAVGLREGFIKVK